MATVADIQKHTPILAYITVRPQCVLKGSRLSFDQQQQCAAGFCLRFAPSPTSPARCPPPPGPNVWSQRGLADELCVEPENFFLPVSDSGRGWVRAERPTHMSPPWGCGVTCQRRNFPLFLAQSAEKRFWTSKLTPQTCVRSVGGPPGCSPSPGWVGPDSPGPKKKPLR